MYLSCVFQQVSSLHVVNSSVLSESSILYYAATCLWVTFLLCVYIFIYIQMDLLNCRLAECCKLMWTFVFLSLCTDLALTAINHPSPDAVQTTAAGFFFPNCGVHTFLLLLFIAFGEVVVRVVLSRVGSVFKLQDQILINWLRSYSGE